MFAYCADNPIARMDSGGDFWHVVAGAVVGGVLGGISKTLECIRNGESIEKTIAQALVSTACGAVGGALAATGIGAVGQVLIGGALGAIESAANQKISTGEINKAQLGMDTISGAVGGYAGGKGAANGSKFMNYHRKQFVKNVSLEGVDKAASKFVKQTWKWSKSNLKNATYRGVITAFLGNKLVTYSAAATPWMVPG